MQGKKETPPKEILLEQLSSEYGWTPKQIRDQRYSDIVAYLKILKVKYELKEEKQDELESKAKQH